jgi:hypothetical protein
MSSIGAHIYGADGGSYNSASVIGKLGNPYNDYIAAIGLKLENKGLNLVSIVALNWKTLTAPSPIRHSGRFIPDATAYKERSRKRYLGIFSSSSPSKFYYVERL